MIQYFQMKIHLDIKPNLKTRAIISIVFMLLGLSIIINTLYSRTLIYNKTAEVLPIEIYEFSQYEPEITLNEVYSEIEERRQEIAALQQQTYVSGSAACYAYPPQILPATKSGDDLLVLVNKTYQLPSTYQPADLVNISTTGIRVTRSDLYIRSIVVEDLTNMVAAIKSKGIDIAALSAYRSYGGQQATYDYWVSYNGGNTALADMVSARAGHSQHQLGTTVDFTTNETGNSLGQAFGNSAAGIWLAENSWKYGFVLAYPKGYECTTGYSYEPWHFRYIGVENATIWKASGKILELWLRQINGL